MVVLEMASPPCQAVSSSQESSKNLSGSSMKIPERMPGAPARWFFTRKILQDDNPSVKSGIDLEKELYYRQQAASFIHDLGSKLQLSHLVMNVAMIYMHRFYVFHSFRRFQRNDVAAACMFLAAKVEEMPRKLEYIVKVAYALQHRDEPQLDTKSNKYNDEAQKIITLENILLQTLGFDLTVAVPNQYVVKCIQMVKAPKELAQAAYHFTNDCLHLTTLCLRYRPAVVACASIFLACSWAKWEIPTSSEGKPWYYYVDNEVTKEILEALAEEIVSVYQKCPDRLKIRRYMGVKRDDSGAGPSTSESGGTEELQDSALYNSITASIVAAAQPKGTATVPKVKVELDLGNAQKSDIVATVEVSSSQKSSSSIISDAAADAAKKQKTETAKVDLKSYMDRMKGRQDQLVNSPKKSFMPDISLTSREKEDMKRQESRSGDRGVQHHGSHRSNYQQGSESRSHSHRQPITSSAHHEHRSVTDQKKAEHTSRPDVLAGGHSSSSKKRPHESSSGSDDRERKAARVILGNGSGSSKQTKDIVAPSSHGHEGEAKMPDVTSKNMSSMSVVNGVVLDERQEKVTATSKERESTPNQKTTSNVKQNRPDDKPDVSRTASDQLPDDETLRQATQTAQLIRKQKLEQLRGMKFGDLSATTSSSRGDKGVKMGNSKDDQPPLPPALPPPLPPPPPPPSMPPP